MKPDAERIVIAVGLIFLAFASIETFATSGEILTREEAIEISRNSPLVQWSLEDFEYYTIDAQHENASTPESHGIWAITWYIHPTNEPSAFIIVVAQSVDDVNGKILREELATLR